MSYSPSEDSDSDVDSQDDDGLDRTRTLSVHSNTGFAFAIHMSRVSGQCCAVQLTGTDWSEQEHTLGTMTRSRLTR